MGPELTRSVQLDINIHEPKVVFAETESSFGVEELVIPVRDLASRPIEILCIHAKFKLVVVILNPVDGI